MNIKGGESSTKVKHIATTKDFEDLLISEADKLIVVDFSAAWCMPCKMIAPVFEEMAGEFESSCTFLKVDVDDTPEVAEKYQVASMPTFLFIKSGELKDRFSGASVEKLRETIQKLL
jgi:thioredoxin 1